MRALMRRVVWLGDVGVELGDLLKAAAAGVAMGVVGWGLAWALLWAAYYLDLPL